MFRRCIPIMLLCACKLKSPTAKSKAGDGLVDGPIVLTPGSPQSPDPSQCKNTFTSSTASTVSGSSAKGRNLFVDLAWQFSDVKSQEYGDCYVYSGLATVESFVNRQYMRKPQIALSEPYAAIATFLDPEGFEFLKNSWVDPIVSNEQKYAFNVFTGGALYWIPQTVQKFPESLVLDTEFSYRDLERIANLIREELVNRRDAKGRVTMSYKEFDSVLVKIESHFNVNPTSDQESWLAPFTKGMRDFYLKRKINEPNSRSIMQGLLNNNLQTKPRSPEVSKALASVQQAKTTNFFDTFSDDDVENISKARENLMSVYLRIALDNATKGEARWLPDPWDPSRRVFSSPASTPTHKPPGQTLSGDLTKDLQKAIQACNDVSAKLRDAIAASLCQGIPVGIGGASMGMLTEEDKFSDAASNFSDATRKIFEEARDWADYIQYLSSKDAGETPPANNSTSFGLGGRGSVSSEPMGYREYRKMIGQLSGPSRGNMATDPLLGTYLKSYFAKDHAMHAMIIDGIEVIDGVTFWRMRNSWGGTGSAFFPVGESCRMTKAVVFKN